MSTMILAPLPSTMAAVIAVHLFGSETRDGASTVAAATIEDGHVVLTTPDAIKGRYYPTIVGTTAGGDPVSVDVAYVDLPYDPGLVITPEYLATRAKIPLPLSEEHREVLTEAILDAQADVQAYLGRPPVPTVYVEPEAYEWADGWQLNQHGDDEIIRILNVDPVPGLEGYWRVTYLAGIDAKNDPSMGPIRRYIRAHALNSPEVTALWKTVTNTQGDVRSVSAEGQSVSFSTPTLGGGGQVGSGAPGALPALSSLDYWRVAGRRVHQGPTRGGQWPYTTRTWERL